MMDYNSAPQQTTGVLTVSLASIKDLFTQAWQRVEKNLYQLFLIHITIFFGILILLVISGAIFYWTGFFAPQPGPIPYSGGSVIVYTIVGVITLLLITVALTSLNITTVLLLSGNSSNSSLADLYQSSLAKVVNLVILLLIGSFLVIGGLVVFILPGILFSLLLSMAFYFVVLEDENPFRAINKSVYAVSKNFGVIFGFAVGLVVVNLIITFILNTIFFNQNLASLPALIITFIVNLIYGWISMAYFLLIFQEVKNNVGKGKTGWMFFIALVGWILIGILGYFILTTPATPTPETLLPTVQTDTLPGFLNLPSDSRLDQAIFSSPSPLVRSQTITATSSGINR